MLCSAGCLRGAGSWGPAEGAPGSPARGAGVGAALQVRELHEGLVEVVELQDAGEQEEAGDEDAGEELGHAELLQAQVPQPMRAGSQRRAPQVGAPDTACPPARHSLLVGEARQVAPVHGEVLKLEGVDGDEHQHGVGHHQPPEGLEQLPPEAVVDLPEGVP